MGYIRAFDYRYSNGCEVYQIYVVKIISIKKNNAYCLRYTYNEQEDHSGKKNGLRSRQSEREGHFNIRTIKMGLHVEKNL